MRHRAKKSLGQHFLTDQHLLHEIVDHIAPQADQCLVEIGPGEGVLSKQLYQLCQKLILIELDDQLIIHLRGLFYGQRHVDIIHADALNFDYSSIATNKSKIVGNLPYNISSQLIVKLVRYGFDEMYFVIQRELGQRICACTKDSNYGRLTLMTQLFAQAEQLFDLPPQAFSPPPKVWSTLIRLRSKAISINQMQFRNFADVVLLAFTQRRKQLANSLSNIICAEQLETLGIDPTDRAQNLTLDHYLRIANLISKKTAC